VVLGLSCRPTSGVACRIDPDGRCGGMYIFFYFRESQFYQFFKLVKFTTFAKIEIEYKNRKKY